MNTAAPLPAPVARSLEELRAAAVAVLGSDLVSLTLYGSAAEGRLRPTSDVNVVFVLERFEQPRVDPLREPLRLAKAAIGLDAMFLLRAEVASAVEAFAEKFADISRRRLVLHGADVFAGVAVPREAVILRLRQVLLNLILRTRRAYLERSLRQEQLVLLLADEAGPLRSMAATLQELEGQPAATPKQALIDFAEREEKGRWLSALETMSEAREQRRLTAGEAGAAVLALIALAEALRARAERLGGAR